ncbi:MAG: F0F1 ATP synthase subunit A, partial [Pyrinomonadaceae bacterium]
KYTQPLWDKFFAHFGTTAEQVFGPYTIDNAISWYTVMFFIACIVSLVLIWILRGRISDDKPGRGQQTLEVTVLTISSLLKDVVGEHGLKYFPVVATFATLILVSNLLGFLPLFKSPTAATSVTFALSISSFVYYNYIGIKENGLLGHLKHFAGPIWWIAWLIFPLELISNFVRPFSLGVRLFGNLFADEKIIETFANIYPPYTQWIVPIPLMLLGLFVALVQTFVFSLLSMVYLSEVSHAPQSHQLHGEPAHEDDEEIHEFVAPVLT